jgi:hypothetical protein
LAPALIIFGATAWAYLVLGEFVITLNLPERVAAVALAAVFGVHCVRATAREAYVDWTRRALPGVLAAALGVFTLFFSATLMGTSGRSKIAAVTLLLWFLAVATYAIGRLLSAPTPPNEPKLTWKSPTRWLRVGAWVISCGLTAVMLLAVLDAA